MRSVPIQESLPGLARLRTGDGKFCAVFLCERRYLIRVAVRSTRASPGQLNADARYVTCRSHIESHSEHSESQTHASRANHSWVVRQSGQYVRLKNTGEKRKTAGSTYFSVEIACPVFGQRIMSLPIGIVPAEAAGVASVVVRRKDKNLVAIHGLC